MTDLAGELEGVEPAPRSSREPMLDQGEIDALAGFAPEPPTAGESGARAMVGAGARAREPLPMLSVAVADWAARLSARLRAMLGNEVDVVADGPVARRYGALVDDLVLPSLAVSFRADGWDGHGLVVLGPAFAILVVDALLGAGRRAASTAIGARPFSTIESTLLTRLADLVLEEGSRAFAPVAPVALRRERVESDPRLVAVARSEDRVHVATFTLTLAGRSAAFHVAIPAATLEPVRGRLGNSFMGVKLGRDERWSGHLATEVWAAEIEAEAVLHEVALPLGQVLGLAVGDTLTFDLKPSDLIEVRCGGLPVTRGRIGRSDGRIAIQIAEPVRRPRLPSESSP